MVSQSADGELIARVCHHLGLGTVRGSPKRGGAQALLELMRDSEKSHWAITPDGPHGPRRQLKSGIVLLASRTGLPIVPLGVGFTHAWRAHSWDRFALPRPFSTVVGFLGEALIVPPDLDSDGIEDHRRRVEQALLAATHAAEQRAEELVSPNRNEACPGPPSIRRAAVAGLPPTYPRMFSSKSPVTIRSWKAMDRTELSNVLLELVEDETGEKFTDMEDSTDLRTGLRLDSLDMVSLILKTETRLNIKIDSSELNGVSTVGRMLDLLQGKLGSGVERKAA